MRLGQLLIIFAALFLTGCGEREVETCNSNVVTDTILKGTIERFKQVEKDRYEKLPAYARDPHADAKLAALSGTVVNIRQTNYDKGNNTRWCAADIEFNEQLQPLWPLSAQLSGIALCEKSFTYKIEKVLDKPDNFYVSWRCVR
jgi:hypothetical protein